MVYVSAGDPLDIFGVRIARPLERRPVVESTATSSERLEKWAADIESGFLATAPDEDKTKALRKRVCSERFITVSDFVLKKKPGKKGC